MNNCTKFASLRMKFSKMSHHWPQATDFPLTFSEYTVVLYIYRTAKKKNKFDIIYQKSISTKKYIAINKENGKIGEKV